MRAARRRNLHVLTAFAVVAALVWFFKTVWERPAGRRAFGRVAVTATSLVVVQLALGVEAWMSLGSSALPAELQPVTVGSGVVRTLHVLVGAGVLARVGRRRHAGLPRDRRTGTATGGVGKRPAGHGRHKSREGDSMKAAVEVCNDTPVWSINHAPSADHAPVARALRRIADYVALTKPRIAILVLFTVAAGALLAGHMSVAPWTLFHVLFGTTLVAAGASTLNQWIERAPDARMRRTEQRPLPAGRLRHVEALLFGAALGAGGVAYLALSLGHWAAAAVAAATFVLYVGAYTPLKSRTTLNTLVGAVPGALPPLIGWAAVRGGLTWEALPLFLIVFAWQVPHFLAIAWIYKDQYARAGLRMQPVFDRTGRGTGGRMVGWCLALLPVSLAPLAFGASVIYGAGAALLGLGFLASAAGFLAAPSTRQARRVLRASLLYLPGVFALLLLDAVIK